MSSTDESTRRQNPEQHHHFLGIFVVLAGPIRFPKICIDRFFLQLSEFQFGKEM
jgi:hypothetical protein